ncbi:5-formyltetrahydrofolate cyclo-ligase [Phyllobacterium sp. 0TCS1.6A]|uniref:5-formyltetrahydrofolate cyclo-ligase n=1 Tax=Phyllobacterium sp. 0TCS1.6A TaxID=2995637 RepID=UPI0022649BA5|nr:5-formyltetrahydrofolate cyclo-ligase [Phyllobacterium sp. 0TCS1.6A]MCX8293000.1 5-formyltetrahydrofolate cyclo-ligase [Phyllobacterium sp. 0TCS1.6A]
MPAPHENKRVHHPSSVKELKKTLRLEALARRDALSAEYRTQASQRIAAAGLETIPVAPGEIVSGFWPIRSEVDLRPLLHALAQRGARLCLPAIIDKQTIVFREHRDDAAMVETGFGTSGPAEDAPVLDPQLMLVPLAAFDARGHRIGYGAGYYDRAIAALRRKGARPRLVGIAFDCQQVATVPDEPHDVPLAAILTESGLRRFATTDKASENTFRMDV